MDLLMNGLLMAATLFAGGYCWVLGRRVQDLKSLDRGLGGSIVTLTRQIELARMTLDEARTASKDTPAGPRAARRQGRRGGGPAEAADRRRAVYRSRRGAGPAGARPAAAAAPAAGTDPAPAPAAPRRRRCACVAPPSPMPPAPCRPLPLPALSGGRDRPAALTLPVARRRPRAGGRRRCRR